MPSLGRSAKVFLPAKMVFADVGVLLLAAKDVAASQDILVDIFGRIEGFFVWLEIYTEVPLTPKVAGRTDLEDGLRELEELINKEVAMSSVQLVNVTDKIDNKVAGIDDGVKGVDVKVQVVNDNVKARRLQFYHLDGKATATEVKSTLRQTADDVDNLKRNQLPTALGNGNLHQIRPRITTSPLEGGWFPAVNSWETYVSFLCGFASSVILWTARFAAGSGKAVLCPAIIDDLTTLCEAGSGSMAYFYFDFRDIDKQARRGLLPSLLVQHFTRSKALCDTPVSTKYTTTAPVGAVASSAIVECQTLQHFIQLGGDVNARDEKQRAPLHLASQALSSSSGDIVQTLIMNGADVNARDERQSSPFASGIVIAIDVVE
ncbi:hypothetical protein EDB83DRAFT_2528063 [Lactarius deliciosus]|nr:hypothetical protein EDB83DRAFT_2528063 [Lactarius deliciosus]